MAIKLARVALAGFVVAAVAAVVSFSLGGRHNGDRSMMLFGFPVHMSFSPGDFSFGGSCGDSTADTATTTRTLPWTDQSGKVEVDLAAVVNWAPGTGTDLSITGPAAAVNQIRIDGDKISSNCSADDFHKLTLTLPGRPFSHYEINGLGQVHLKGLDQPALSLDISGAALVEATGVVPKTDLDVSGAASINLDNLITQDLHADLSGASNLTANPAQSADIDLSGAGLVTLLTRPREYHADISGLGHVEVPDQPPPAS